MKDRTSEPGERTHPSQRPEQTDYEMKEVSIGAIQVNSRLRELKEDAVENLMGSIRHIGLLSPILVTREAGGGTYRLIAGCHRLKACQRLGQQTIKAFITEADDLRCQIAELDENLIIAELTPMEVDRHLQRREEPTW